MMKGSAVAGEKTRRLRGMVLAAATIVLLGGCATTGNGRDPIEGLNRATFAFNEAVDTMLVRPVARGYEATLPAPVRTGVMNFFGNIADVFIAVNNLLQGKPTEAAGDAGRFLVNSTIGVLGIFDVASSMGLEKHEEDFGQTFGRWGVEPGAYLVVPFFGPRDVRDTFGLVLDVAVDPVGNVGNVRTRNTLLGLRMTSDRAGLLPADKVIAEAALDKYSYVRDAYLQRRRSLVYDGRPPREPDFE
jgi:phospholipid-binding lipoprotein MlaA